MDCYWNTDTQALVAEQDEYCSPLHYKVTQVLWMDSDGNWFPLRPTTPERLDGMVGGWRNDLSQATLRWCAFEGVNRVKLYPKPNFSLASALKFEGYMNTNASGASTWALNSSDCPLPSWTHEAIAVGAAMDLCMQMMSSGDDGMMARGKIMHPTLMEMYAGLEGSAEQASATYFQSAIWPNIGTAWRGWAWG